MHTPSPIELAEKEIQRDKDDLKRLKKRYPGYDFVRMDNVDKVPQPPPPAVTYMEVAIEGLFLSSQPDQEWTSRAILNDLKDKGIAAFTSEEVGMNAVALALAALRDAGKIRRVHEGRGRDPHRYAALEKEAIPEEIAS